MKNLKNHLTQKTKRFVYLDTSPSGSSEKAILTKDNFESPRPTDEEIAEHNEKILKLAKEKGISHDKLVEIFKKVLNRVEETENDEDLKLEAKNLGELMKQLNDELESVGKTEAQSDYGGLEAREGGKDWKENLSQELKTKLDAWEKEAGSFEKIPGKHFIELTRAEKVQLFVEKLGDKYSVDFHGNRSAYRAIGAGDLLCDEKERHDYVKINDKIGKITISSVFGESKIGYEDINGTYLGIHTGTTINLNISADEITKFEEEAKENDITYEELDFTKPKDGEEETEEQKLVRKTRENFKNEFEKNEEIRKQVLIDFNDYDENELGSLSARFESNNSSMVISHDRTGGWSYGKYQLTEKSGQVKIFAAKMGIKGTVGSDEFANNWRKKVKENPESFSKAEYEYIKKTHYIPLMTSLIKKGLVDLSIVSNSFKNVVWSTAVQHGPNTNVISKVINKLGIKPDSPENEKKIIEAIYKERKTRFVSSTAAIRQSVCNRFDKEMELALLG